LKILGIFRQSQSKEIAALRAQIIGIETDNDRLKRQLTSERFERFVSFEWNISSWFCFFFNFREKAAQDLRKLSDLTSHIDYEARFRNTSPLAT